MFWPIFKKCCKNKRKSAKSDDTKQLQVNDPKIVVQELLSKLDEIDDLDTIYDDHFVYVSDKHFDYLSVIDPYRELRGSVPEITAAQADQNVIENDAGRMMDELNDTLEESMVINNRCTEVTEKQLKSLQCPFTWNFESNVWNKNMVNRIEKKYGKFNMDLSVATFSLEKYTSNLIVGCGLYKTNGADKAHNKLIRIWEWLDKLDNADDAFYIDIREGLKHIMMSTLCHILYSMNRMECRQLFEMITRFSDMSSKSRAAVNAIRAVFCIEIGGKALENVVQHAKNACDLDPDTAQWHYIHSLAMTARRQYLNTNKSCPADVEFDAVQHAIILANEPNAYFNFHRMVLMTNKMLYHYLNNGTRIDSGNSSEKILQNVNNIVELIKAIVAIEAGDPHLVVKCAKSLLTLPYLNQDDVHLAKQMITIAVNTASNDPTVVRAIEKSIEIFKELVNVYMAIKDEKKTHPENTQVEHHQELQVDDKVDHDLENDLKLIAQKNKKGSKPVMDLIQLLEKYDGNYRWKIMAQICSYSLLFKDSANLLVSVEQFMMLIHDRDIANSDTVKNHRSIFIKDESKVFNLAELMCNEIKLAIIQGHVKNQDQTQFCLDQLTKIMEVCQIKSKNVNHTMKIELTGCGAEKQQNGLKENNAVKRKNDLQNGTKPTAPKKFNKPRRIKQTPSNVVVNTRVNKSNTRRRNHITT